MVDRLLMILEILLLIWIVVQGEYVRFYEREVFRMNKERYEERAKWRREKQEQARRKNAQKILDSSANSESPSPTETDGQKNRIINAKSVAALSTLMDTRQ